MQHLRRTPLNDSYICRKHLLEAQQHHSTPNFIPKWKGSVVLQASPKCINPNCTQLQGDKVIKPAFESIDKLVQSSPDSPFVVCQPCYNELYKNFTRQHPVHLAVQFLRLEPACAVIAQMQLLYPNTYRQ